MENELRYYLKVMRDAMLYSDEEIEALERGEDVKEIFTPSYLITAVKLPTGAIELAINNENIVEKIDYILEAYDEDMKLKTNPEISMSNMMIV